MYPRTHMINNIMLSRKYVFIHIVKSKRLNFRTPRFVRIISIVHYIQIVKCLLNEKSCVHSAYMSFGVYIYIFLPQQCERRYI